MPYLKTNTPETDPVLAGLYQKLTDRMGAVPTLFESMNLRPDLLDALVELWERLMAQQHQLSRTTKELLAAYVSHLNSCAY